MNSIDITLVIIAILICLITYSKKEEFGNITSEYTQTLEYISNVDGTRHLDDNYLTVSTKLKCRPKFFT